VKVKENFGVAAMFVFYIKKQPHTLPSQVTIRAFFRTLFSAVGVADTTTILRVLLSAVNQKVSWWSDLQ
jgi:hypothetical protein